MKLKLKIILTLIAFFIWGLTGGTPKESENKSIRKITETTELCFGGQRNIWTIRKNEKIFNPKGQLTEYIFYHRKDFDNKIIYKYNEFDSLINTTHFDSELKIEEVEEYTYDAQKRHLNDVNYRISTMNNDTTYTCRTTWYYDDYGRKYKKIKVTNEKCIGCSYEPPHTAIKTDVFDAKGLIVRDTYYFQVDTMISTEITKYLYDEKNNRIAKFGSDSIYYKRNDKGQIIEEYLKNKDYIRTKAKYYYDERGNEIKTFLNIDSGLVYEFKYDKNNRLIKEYRPDGLLFLRTCVIYRY